MGKAHSKALQGDQQFISDRDTLCHDFLEAKRLAQKHCEEEVSEIRREFNDKVLQIQSQCDNELQLLRVRILRERERAKHERNFFENKLIEALKGCRDCVNEGTQTEHESMSGNILLRKEEQTFRDCETSMTLSRIPSSEKLWSELDTHSDKMTHFDGMLRHFYGHLGTFVPSEDLIQFKGRLCSTPCESAVPTDSLLFPQEGDEDEAREGTGDSGTEVEYAMEKKREISRRKKSNRNNYWQTKYFDMQRKYDRKMMDMEKAYSEQKRLLMESLNKEKLALQEKHILEMKSMNEKFLHELERVRSTEREKYGGLVQSAQREADEVNMENSKLNREVEEFRFLLATVLPSHSNELRESLFKLQDILLTQDRDC